jgi:hypothetical protein
MDEQPNSSLRLKMENIDVDEKISHGRNFSLWAIRTKTQTRKAANIIIPFDSQNNTYYLKDDTELGTEKKQIVLEKLKHFNTLKSSTRTSQILFKALLILLGLITLIIYTYACFITILITIYNPMICVMLIMLFAMIIKGFIITNILVSEKIRKNKLNNMILYENITSKDYGFKWLSGRDGYWLEISKL